MDILVKNVVIDDTNELVDIGIDNGIFKRIGKELDVDAKRIIDGYGRVVIPGLVESHIHLDKALIADRLPNKSGTLQEALKVTAELKSTFTREDVRERAEQALQMIIKRGTTHIRTHAEFDPVGGFHGFEVIMELKEKYKDFVDMQVVAFPQEGIIKAPGTEELMYRAMDMGADVVGGIPYNDSDPKKHLDIVFEIAKKYDKDIDLHQDFKDDAEGQTIEMVAQRAIDEGYVGRVSVGHLTSLGAVPDEKLKPIIELMAKADINVMSLPMTDLHLGGRHDEYNVRRAVTPIRKLRDGGVNVVLATNNIRNPFTPYGNGDLMQVAMLAIPVAHLGGADDLHTVLPMITSKPARALKLDDYGIEEGKPATLVLLDTTDYQNAVIDIPDRLFVIKKGKVTVEMDKHIQIEWPK
ncbi:amidohydrolase family protein [Jeotgalibaca ciconiae]|uniref:N-acyl-D-amino-acid deacylase n=1 Tax=Jeotgalibaca ciconiae TaxID=2496265 RepID=A0A3S9H994_9LACT|nr:amidohydrolase family protein [Jeotgalibaca ciconiae]AZP03914.1 N-acyl-D-amino-acid deacylase [Jeotgalibaca ciconiae]HJB22817.1 amidohydrolase family protein [Candidatus Jeotgalibaca pullicola]